MALNNVKDITGMRSGRLVAVRKTDKRINKHVVWECKCDCGNTNEVTAAKIIAGLTRSCGCLAKEKFDENKIKPKHHMYKTRPYEIWHSMKQRVLNPNSDKFHHYGGRGIKICGKWMEFEGFWEDMSKGYQDHLTLDRIEVNGDYEPGNCRWITQQEQLNNTRRNIIIELDGITDTLKGHSQRLNINYGTVQSRIRRHNWDVIRALTTPIKR